MTSDLDFTGKESFFDQEVKFARRWLTTKGVMMQEEQQNPVDVELESFFQNCRDGKKPQGRPGSRAGRFGRGDPLESGDGRRPQGLLQRDREDGPRRSAEEGLTRATEPRLSASGFSTTHRSDCDCASDRVEVRAAREGP